MQTLVLSGFGIKMQVNDGKLVVTDGTDRSRTERQTYLLRPKMYDYNSIVIYGHSGNISLDALKWVSKQNLTLSILNWNGKLLTSINQPEVNNIICRANQYKIASSEKGVEIGQKFIDSKIKASIAVLEWVWSRHADLADSKDERLSEIQSYHSRLADVDNQASIRGIEGMVARVYWEEISKVFDLLPSLITDCAI
jgi:CRISP-associated protein Cas1